MSAAQLAAASGSAAAAAFHQAREGQDASLNLRQLQSFLNADEPEKVADGECSDIVGVMDRASRQAFLLQGCGKPLIQCKLKWRPRRLRL